MSEEASLHDVAPIGNGMWDRVAHMRAGTRIALALGVSLLTWALLPSRLAIELRAVAVWDAFAGAALLFTWFTILTVRSAQIHALARREDHTLLALSAVALTWLLMHTVFTVRYGHLYHDGSPTALAENGPLDFPGMEGLPDYLDFAYFAFVVGMTAQTSDVSIRSRRIRRTALLHGLIAWLFNTSVVALLISVLSSIIGA